MYDSLMEDKNNEIKKLQKEYEDNRNNLKNKYKEEIESGKEMKSEIYFTDLFNEIKNNIINVIKPLNNKKVAFLNVEEKSKEN